MLVPGKPGKSVELLTGSIALRLWRRGADLIATIANNTSGLVFSTCVDIQV